MDADGRVALADSRRLRGDLIRIAKSYPQAKRMRISQACYSVAAITVPLRDASSLEDELQFLSRNPGLRLEVVERDAESESLGYLIDVEP